MNAQSKAAIQWEMTETASTVPAWRNLYRIGAAAAILSAVFFPLQIATIFISPPPSTVFGWFAVFQSQPLMGLLNLDLLLVCDQVLAMLIFLALYVALKHFNRSAMAIGTLLALASTVLFIASNPAFGMLSLSGQYTTAGTEAQKVAILAAGQVLLATWQGSAFQVSYFLGSVASVIISLVMLESKLFSKLTSYMGILANALALGLYIPHVGTYISIFSVVFLWFWYLLMAGQLFQLGGQANVHQ